MFNWLTKLFRVKDPTDSGIWVYAKCLKCDNVLNIHVDPSTDLIRGFSESEPPYSLHKETVDDKCYNTIIIDIKYDDNYHPLEKNISGAEFINAEEFKKNLKQ